MVLRRCLTIATFVAVTTLAGAQQRPTSALDSAAGWLQTQWKRVETEGRPAAERIVRQFPARFRDMKGQVARVSKLAGEFSSANKLEERKLLLLELWRVRGSLNILGLLTPDVLHQLTGLDVKTLTAMQNQVNAARARVTAAR